MLPFLSMTGVAIAERGTRHRTRTAACVLELRIYYDDVLLTDADTAFSNIDLKIRSPQADQLPVAECFIYILTAGVKLIKARNRSISRFDIPTGTHARSRFQGKRANADV